ncbi:MAG: hypothetical protein AAFR26_03690 [Cyanobacteria bacterium J06626_4]
MSDRTGVQFGQTLQSAEIVMRRASQFRIPIAAFRRVLPGATDILLHSSI